MSAGENLAKDAIDSSINSAISDKADKCKPDTTASFSTTPDLNHPRTIDEVITPLSPVDPVFPHPYFASIERKPDGGTLREQLKSSGGRIEDFAAVKPDSPVFTRPTSPKSRNASRTRQPEQAPGLTSHGLVRERLICQKAAGAEGPPKYAADAPDRNQSSFMSTRTGTRDTSISVRPKSTVW